MTNTSKFPASPYAVGAAIGLLSAFAFATAKRGLGVTTAFESSAALAGKAFAPRLTHVNAYLKEREEVPKFDWESTLVIGVLAGSYLSARLAGESRSTAIPALWQRRFGSSRPARDAGAFAGGAAMMLGSRMAKGCTSGHGITGTMQFAASSLTFTPAMFAVAALAARALFGKGTK